VYLSYDAYIADNIDAAFTSYEAVMPTHFRLCP
jgi:hypothetical protein